MAKKRKPPTPTVQDYVNMLVLRGYEVHFSGWAKNPDAMWVASTSRPYYRNAVRGTKLSAIRALCKITLDDSPTVY